MPDATRHTRALEPTIVTDPDQLVRLEVFNTAQQILKVEEMVGYFLDPERPFSLRPSHVLTLHRAAMDGISGNAGVYRPAVVEIGGSRHTPPQAFEVPERIEEMCDYVNEKWLEKKPLHLAAYIMWRLNWIHPFTDGNGRTSRAVAYLVLCIRLKMLLPGENSIPQQIEQERTPYYKALEAADIAWSEGRIDLSEMKKLLSGMLASQLLQIHQNSDLGGE